MQLQQTIGNRAVEKLLSEIGLIHSKAKQSPPVQMQTMPEEEIESLQGKFTESVQRQEISEEEKKQLQIKRKNNTGMPDNLKAGMKSLSGIDMSNVRVYYNSSKPAEVGALAYTQGNNIHLALGQEKYLPHETWHVVQQMQGRVKATAEFGGVPINDEEELEREADVMGARAQTQLAEQPMISSPYQNLASMQREINHEDKLEPYGTGTIEYAPQTHVVQQSNQVQPVQRQADQCVDLLANPTIVSLLGGSAVHAAICDHFAISVAGATKVSIPGASASPQRTAGLCGEDTTVTPPQLIGGRAGLGFPDLARIKSGVLEVAEIKPAAFECLVDGETQLMRYIDQGNATDPAQVAWRKSKKVTAVVPMPASTYQPPSFSLGVAHVKTAWCSPGLLGYTVSASAVPIKVPVPSPERSKERERYRKTAGDRIPVEVAVGAGAVATVVAGRALWRHFWSAVAKRFAIRGAVAVGLAAADGPLPFGELLDIGIGVVTAIEILVMWNDLWYEADRIASEEGA